MRTIDGTPRKIPAAIVDVITTHLGLSEAELTLDAELVRDLGADSMDLVEMQLEIEVLYGVSAEDAWLDDGAPLTIGMMLADLRRLGARL